MYLPWTVFVVPLWELVQLYGANILNFLSQMKWQTVNTVHLVANRVRELEDVNVFLIRVIESLQFVPESELGLFCWLKQKHFGSSETF